MKRTIATLSTLVVMAGTTGFMVADGGRDKHVVATSGVLPRITHEAGPDVSELKQMVADKLSHQNALAKAEEEKEREARARKVKAAEVVASAKRSESVRQSKRKTAVNRTRATRPVYNYKSPGGIDACIRKYESGGNYRALNSGSGASGAYQFMDSTWRSITGLSGKAMYYSPAQQDSAFWKLWNNGRGAHNWVTAGMCGY